MFLAPKPFNNLYPCCFCPLFPGPLPCYALSLVITRRTSPLPLILLLTATVLLIPLRRNVLFIPAELQLYTGYLAALGFVLTCFREPKERARIFGTLGLMLALLALAPVNTGLGPAHVLTLGAVFVAVLVLPPLLLGPGSPLSFKWLPDKLDRVDILYTLSAVPLAWGGFALYFGVLSPQTPFNWSLPPEPDGDALFSLFMGINAVGIWDELFFINVCFACLRALYGFRTANLGQAVIYASVLYDMAFTGWGPVFIYVLALTQGFMYERSKVLIYVVIVHLIVDYFLFQAIVGAYYPQLEVWWHP